MNEQAIILGLRAAASTMTLVQNGGFNLHKLALAVEDAARAARQPTDAELLATSNRLDNKIDAVFGDVGLRGVEANDAGDEQHNDH